MKEDSVCKEEVFAYLFDSHGVALRNFMYYRCGDVSEAEDLLQDAFVKLWENCKKVTSAKAKSYLYTVANNLFLNKVKHRKVVLAFEKRQKQQENLESPDFHLEEKEFKERLEKALSNLPDKQRTVFLMNRIDGLTYKEIAERLDIGVKAVEKRMHLALKSLRKLNAKI